MSTFAEYKKNRPADPTLVAQYKATMQYQLDREKLAELLDSHQPDIDDLAATITNCTCGEILNDIPYWQNPYTNHLADTIIQAGWTEQKEES